MILIGKIITNKQRKQVNSYKQNPAQLQKCYFAKYVKSEHIKYQMGGVYVQKTRRPKPDFFSFGNPIHIKLVSVKE